MTYSSLHVYITTYFIFISAHSPSSHYPTTRRLSSLCLSLPHRSPFHRQTPSLRSSSSIARPISPPPSSKEPGIPVRPLLWRFAADLGCATGSRPKGDTEESPPQRSGEIDPTKGDFRRRSLAPRLLRSNACGNPARPADATSEGVSFGHRYRDIFYTGRGSSRYMCVGGRTCRCRDLRHVRNRHHVEKNLDVYIPS